MLVNFKTEEVRAATPEKSYSNDEALQIMLVAMLKSMSSLLQLQSKELKGQSDISTLSTEMSAGIIDDYKTQLEENQALVKQQQTSDEALKWFGWAATALSIVIGTAMGGPAGFAISVGLAALLTPGLVSPSKNGDTTILGRVLDDLLLEDASSEVRGLVKMATIISLCVVSGRVGSIGQAATSSIITPARYWAVQAAVQGLSGLNPTADLAMIGADKNDDTRKEIAQYVAMGVNLLATVGSLGVSGASMNNIGVFASNASAQSFNRALTTTTAVVDTGKSAVTIHGGTIRLDIADSQKTLALTNSVMTEQSGLQKLAQQQVSQRSKDYKSAVEEGNAAVNQYADWTTGLYASANAIAANAS